MLVKREASSSDYEDVLKLWEESVRETHHFLSPEDIQFYKEKIPSAFEKVRLYGYG